MEESKKVIVAGASFIILVAIILLVYFVFIRDSGPPVSETPEPVLQEEAEPVPEEVADEPSEEPETIDIDLDESDDIIHGLIKELSAHPEFAKWILSRDMIRKFVAAVDNIANGHSPRGQIDFFKPQEKFSAQEKQAGFILDPASYQRYDVVADVFSSLDTPGCVRLFSQLKPALQEAYSDLGYPEADFRGTLIQAMDELLEVPIVEQDIVLEEKLRSFELTDPKLENMSQAQKHLFRMGPSNIRKIQAKLRQFKAEL